MDLRMLRKIKWDLDSPRFKEAQLNLGYKDEDLTIQDIKHFQQ